MQVCNVMYVYMYDVCMYVYIMRVHACMHVCTCMCIIMHAYCRSCVETFSTAQYPGREGDNAAANLTQMKALTAFRIEL
jgi:hypothetical protein